MSLKATYSNSIQQVSGNFSEKLFNILAESVKSDIKKHYGVQGNFNEGLMDHQVQAKERNKNANSYIKDNERITKDNIYVY